MVRRLQRGRHIGGAPDTELMIWLVALFPCVSLLTEPPDRILEEEGLYSTLPSSEHIVNEKPKSKEFGSLRIS